jgi:hypothetical protein
VANKILSLPWVPGFSIASTTNLAPKAASIAPSIRTVAIEVAFVQGLVMNGAALIRFLAIDVTFVQGKIMNGAPSIRSVAIEAGFVQGRLMDGAIDAVSATRRLECAVIKGKKCLVHIRKILCDFWQCGEKRKQRTGRDRFND